MKIDINKLQSHPLNQRIYGYDDNSELLEKIKSSGWIKPILITPNYTILSGHRRVDCCKTLGITEIECEVIEGDPIKCMEIMLSENAYRVKSTFQLMKEAEMYLDIEKKKAYQRQIQAEKIGNDHQETFPQGQSSPEKGQSRDIVAEKIGMSGRSYDKGRKVLQRIDEETDPELRDFFIESLNENVDATAKLIDKPYGTIKEIKDRAFVNLKDIGKVVREVEQEELKQKSHLPPGKYQVLHCDLTNNSLENLTKLPISEIGESDSVLFLWTTPTKLSLSLELVKSWGFRYKTCMIWYKDVFEVSDKTEILTISTKGSPPMIQQTDESVGKTQKPELVRDMISTVYSGTKVELTFGDSNLDGWDLWN